MPRRRRSGPLLAVVLAAATAALVVTACSPERDGAAPPDVPRDAPDTSGWTLPLSAYRPTEAERHTLVRAETVLVRSCMKRFAVEWRAPDELPVVGPRNSMDWRYGIHDARLAATRGFQPDAAQQQRYDLALHAADTRPRLSPDEEVVLGGTGLPPEALAAAGAEVRGGSYHGRRIPEGGCFSEARRRLGTVTYGTSPLVSELYGRSFAEATKDPAVRGVFRRWSACMKKSGFVYEDPLRLFDDKRFGRERHTVTGTEISVALTDIGCRGSLRVARTWHAAETRVQRQYIRAHSDELEAERRSLKRALASARTVLG
ncbi:hypothetical protein [Streptomyces sp. NPDC093094]|uniref:hypothetical protein n=1 Tax=Streptomyces sp. NPDC093094 TaxID=3366026 RepID=UPI00383073B3